MCSRNVDWPHTYKLILQSIETLICWLVSFFNLQDVKGVWLDQCCTSRSRAYDLKCQVVIIRVNRNQRLPQHDADHVPVRTYKEIGDAPEHVSFASHHLSPGSMLHDARCLLDLEGPIISQVRRTHTLWPRRHGQPPTIGPPERNDDQPVPDLQDVRGWSIWIN